MLENISRMFSSNDPDTEEEPDEPTEGGDATGEEPAAGSEPAVDGADAPPAEGAAPEADGPDPAELDVRLDELDEELSSTDASLRELRSSQEEMAESIDEVNDTVRQLVGVYDRLAAEENPFVDDPGAASPDSEPPIPGADGGVDADGQAGHEADEGAADDEVVAFEDLERADPQPVEREHPIGDPAADESAGLDPDRGRPAAGTASERATTPEPGATTPEPVLASIPDGYAGEVLVMEWLATLMERSGPAGAFRAVDYYENVGWISPAVEERLVDAIGGPALDVFVDPTQPREPTAEEHAVSHEYLRVMARLNEI